jgi:hypothetical protein
MSFLKYFKFNLSTFILTASNLILLLNIVDNNIKIQNYKRQLNTLPYTITLNLLRYFDITPKTPKSQNKQRYTVLKNIVHKIEKEMSDIKKEIEKSEEMSEQTSTKRSDLSEQTTTKRSDLLSQAEIKEKVKEINMYFNIVKHKHEEDINKTKKESNETITMKKTLHYYRFLKIMACKTELIVFAVISGVSLKYIEDKFIKLQTINTQKDAIALTLMNLYDDIISEIVGSTEDIDNKIRLSYYLTERMIALVGMDKEEEEKEKEEEKAAAAMCEEEKAKQEKEM